MELEFATTKEIINELLKRSTFAGIIISSTKELTNPKIELDEWELNCKNLSIENIKFLLKFLSEKIEDNN